MAGKCANAAYSSPPLTLSRAINKQSLPISILLFINFQESRFIRIFEFIKTFLIAFALKLKLTN